MPRRSLRCVVEIKLHAVTCPGVYLPRRDDVYLSVCLLGQVRRTQLTCPIFPVTFHDRFNFDKVFYSAYEPSQVADSLEDEPVVIELIQLSDIYEGGKLLASYETNARDFLYPYPSYTPTYGTQDRDVLLERNLDFPGIAPRLEFSTKTTIREISAPYIPDLDDDLVYTSRSTRKSRTRTKSPVRKSIAYGRPTVSSITRARSLSPSIRRRFDALDIEDQTQTRPPFVVRKALSSYSDVDVYSDYGGSDLLDLTSTRPRYSSPSPLRSSVAERYWSPTRSEVIQARVDRAVERNRLLDKYDTLYPYSSYRYQSDISALDDLELDLELTRRRRQRFNYY